jgi:hypothetical protein
MRAARRCTRGHYDLDQIAQVLLATNARPPRGSLALLSRGRSRRPALARFARQWRRGSPDGEGRKVDVRTEVLSAASTRTSASIGQPAKRAISKARSWCSTTDYTVSDVTRICSTNARSITHNSKRKAIDSKVAACCSPSTYVERSRAQPISERAALLCGRMTAMAVATSPPAKSSVQLHGECVNRRWRVV